MRWMTAIAVACLSLAGILANASPAPPPTARTVYVTVVDSQGHTVPGLGPDDFSVKESGRDCEITSAAPASTKIRLALMVGQPLAGFTDVRVGLAEFVGRMYPSAEIALFLVAQRAEKVVDFTSSQDAIVDGIRNLPMGRVATNAMAAEAVFEVAKQFEKATVERPVIVLATTEQDLAAEDPEGILGQLAKSKAQFWAVSAGRGRGGLGIGDGAKQSGGRIVPILALPSFKDGLQHVADDLSSQYLITYALPGGVKTSDRITVSVKKPGLTLLAPNRVPK